MKKRKEDLKELVLYTVFGNMTFIISIASYAVFNVALGINELIANALAGYLRCFFVYYQQKMGISRINTYKNSSTCADVCVFQWQIFTLIIEETIILFYNDAFVPKHVGEAGCPGGGSGAQLHN